VYDVTRREVVSGVIVGSILVVVALAFTYAVAHRTGRGAACFDVAVNTKDSAGRSLRSLLLSRDGATWDYSFWGSDCTISLYALQGGKSTGGHWRYVVKDARLYADDDEATRIFPAAGRWQPEHR
jgi:hypothetical protein